MNEYKVSLEQEGKRLDVFLTDVMEGSRSYIQSLIKSGHVLVNGKVGKANFMKIMILLSSTSLVAWLYIQQLVITQER